VLARGPADGCGNGLRHDRSRPVTTVGFGGLFAHIVYFSILFQGASAGIPMIYRPLSCPISVSHREKKMRKKLNFFSEIRLKRRFLY
jgi:hypothetical protein